MEECSKVSVITIKIIEIMTSILDIQSWIHIIGPRPQKNSDGKQDACDEQQHFVFYPEQFPINRIGFSFEKKFE